jgi:hypothetical protein
LNVIFFFIFFLLAAQKGAHGTLLPATLVHRPRILVFCVAATAARCFLYFICAMSRSLLLLLAFAACAAAGRPSIAALKQLSASETRNYIVVGRPMTVTYMVFNIGDAPALDVALEDEWPADR